MLKFLTVIGPARPVEVLLTRRGILLTKQFMCKAEGRRYERHWHQSGGCVSILHSDFERRPGAVNSSGQRWREGSEWCCFAGHRSHHDADGNGAQADHSYG